MNRLVNLLVINFAISFSCSALSLVEEKDDSWAQFLAGSPLQNNYEGMELQDDDETMEGIKIYKNPRNAPSNNCPRDEDAAHRMGRTCLRKCSSDSDCLSRKKVCLCDGICGMSCIKPDKECGELVNPMFGFVEVNGRVVGSKAKYKCQKVYHLIGSEERICQADGSWSRTPPECRENLYCTEPPQISNAKHDVPEGQTRFNVNHTLQYSCEEGYTTRGFTVAKCFLYNGTMQWFGPEIKCMAKSCGDPGDIINGFKEGSCFKYSCKVNFYCRPGFELVGRADRYCQHDGTWSPRELPSCKDVQCDVPSNPDHGKVEYTTVSYNSVITYECEHGFMIVGSSTRRCGPNRKWSGTEPECKEINCRTPGHLSNGWLENTEQGTALGATIIFKCYSNTTLMGANTTVCQSDGKWSRPLPKCLAPCIIPNIENGILNNTDDIKKVEHGFELEVICSETFELEFGNSPPTCYNGTWSKYPRCKPARCQDLPRTPRHGMVIAPKSEHGMKAKFRCKDGYRLKGNATTECQFGKWREATPNCVQIFCPYPGTIDNGRVLLVGNMGMYDYRSYVQKIQNNRQIMYECNKGFYLVKGPPGSTCVAGRWSPDKMPKCVPDLHPRAQWFRRKRSIEDSFFTPNDTDKTTESPEQEFTKSSGGSKNIFSENAKIEIQGKKQTESLEVSKISVAENTNTENQENFELNKQNLTERLKDSEILKNKTTEQRSKRSLTNVDFSKNFLKDYFLYENSLKQGIDSGRKVKRKLFLNSRGKVKRATTEMSEKRKLKMERREKRRKLRIRKKGFRGKRAFAHCEEIKEEPYMEVTIVRPGRDDNYTFSAGARLKVTCLHGYGLNIGNKSAKCARGRWKPMKPECFNLPCSVPETHHGEFTYNGQSIVDEATISHGEVVKFSCEPGYDVIGSDTMRCWYGEWAVTGKNPECHANSCVLPEIQFGQYDSGYKANLSIIHGALVEYKCDEGYIKAVTDIRCHIGHLQPTPATCIAPVTTVASVPIKRSESIKVKNDVSVQTTTGSPVGRTYQDSQSVKTKASTKVEVLNLTKSCPMPPKIAITKTKVNGIWTPNPLPEYAHGSNVTIHCEPAFTANGAPGRMIWFLKCINSVWDGTIGNCDHGDDGVYGDQPCVWNKTDEKVVTFYNDQELTDQVVEFPAASHLISRCIDIGKYQMTGGIIRKCKHGEFTGDDPECIGLSQEFNYALDKPPTILIRHYRGPIAQSNDGKLVVYPRTTLHLECLWIRRYGTPRWNVSQTITEIGHRKKKKKKKKAKAAKRKGRGGLKIDRKYPEGWTTDPERNRQLEYRLSLYLAKKDDSGLYICTTPTMTQHMVNVDIKAVHCPNVQKTIGLHISPNSTKMSTVAKFNCDPGSMLVGAKQITCKPSGNWSAPLPHCEKVRCRPPKPPKNGSVDGVGPFHAGDMVQISCHPNFMMEGSPMIVCQKDGNWSEEISSCVEACTYPGTIISGTMSSVKFYYGVGDTITYTCSDGFTIHGARKIECLDMARWSGPVPTCLPQS